MNIKTKLTLNIGVLVAMIVLLVSLSIVNLQILTATEPTSPAAGPGLHRALLWISILGGICIVSGLLMLKLLPALINKPIQEITDGIKEIANHNYAQRLNLGSREFKEMSENFNRMANRLADYHSSTLAEIKASKNYMETIINSVKEPVIGLNKEMTVLFINDEALNILNLKREGVLQKPAQDIALHNDLFRRLVRGGFLRGGRGKGRRTLEDICRQQGKLFPDEMYAHGQGWVCYPAEEHYGIQGA